MKTNDPRITAYALGELSGPDREKFELELATSAELQTELEATFNMMARLSQDLMENEKLNPETRKQLLKKCSANQAGGSKQGEPHTKVSGRNILKLLVPVSLAAAACILMMPALFEGEGNNRLFGLEESLQGNNSAAKSQPLTWGKVEGSSSGSSSSSSSGGSGGGPMVMASAMPMTARGGAYMPNGGPGIMPEMENLAPPQEPDFNTEAYNAIKENSFLEAKGNPLSTFSIDVDTASYSNVRRFLQENQNPPAGAIRTEELINYFQYNYAPPTNGEPFSINIEMSKAPWAPERQLVRIGLKGKEIPAADRPQANLVFLIDVSGSMDQPDKLPLVIRSLKGLVDNLAPTDRIAIVTYAGEEGLALAPTPGSKKEEILRTLENLRGGGATKGSAGIKLAYETARENFLKDGVNRVILCSDGDFNVGVTDQSELERIIEKERASGVFLSVLGFGTGNIKDSTMELLADKGNGNYAYIDTINEGRKVLVDQMGSTLFTIAKDVKIQVEFNPAHVAAYRLIGYENRLLAKEDFNNDKKDAGEIGAGHTVTALYEIIPTKAGAGTGAIPGTPSVDPLKYQKVEPVKEGQEAQGSNELLTVKLRYKAPDGETSKLIEVPLASGETPAFEGASSDFQFASAVAAFAMKLRKSPDSGDLSWEQIQNIARSNLGQDPGSYRAEFLTLVEAAKRLPKEAEQ
jgi:Ca-activated chloride channel homolog